MNATMTPEQQLLAEKNHNLIYTFMQSHNLSLNAVEDWYGVVAIGLCRAAMTFDPTKGCEFSTFAYTCMENEVRREIRDRHNDASAVVSLDETIPGADETLYVDTVSDGSDFTLAMEQSDILSRAFRGLTDSQQKIIRLVFGQGYTGVEVARKLGISPQYISQVCRRFRRLIRKYDDSLI